MFRLSTTLLAAESARFKVCDESSEGPSWLEFKNSSSLAAERLDSSILSANEGATDVAADSRERSSVLSTLVDSVDACESECSLPGAVGSEDSMMSTLQRFEVSTSARVGEGLDSGVVAGRVTSRPC